MVWLEDKFLTSINHYSSRDNIESDQVGSISFESRVGYGSNDLDLVILSQISFVTSNSITELPNDGNKLLNMDIVLCRVCNLNVNISWQLIFTLPK